MTKYFTLEDKLYIIFNNYLLIEDKLFTLDNSGNLSCFDCEVKDNCSKLKSEFSSYLIIPRPGQVNLITNILCYIILNRVDYKYIGLRKPRKSELSLFMSRYIKYIKVNIVKIGIKLNSSYV